MRCHWDLVIAALLSLGDELVTITVREVRDGRSPNGAGRSRRDADFTRIV